jgi:hypothetical protein
MAACTGAQAAAFQSRRISDCAVLLIHERLTPHKPTMPVVRQSRKPLENVIVTISQYSGGNTTGAYFVHSAPPILDPDTGEETGKRARLYVVTIALFRVAFQIAYYRRPVK